ncbi:hypothetical protein JCM6882_000685 [Rhodosporidiobolus microsporus]
MPTPPLPLEVVALILSHLGDAVDESGRRENGKELALVCKAWTPLAYEMMFRDLKPKPKRDEGLIKFLFERPHLLAHVRQLDLSAFSPSTESEDEAEDTEGTAEGDRKLSILEEEDNVQPLYELVGGCIRLRTLNIPAGGPTINFLPFFAKSPSASTLTSLYLDSMGYQSFDVDNLASHLAKLKSLEVLELRLCLFSTSPCSYNCQPPPDKVPLKRISLNILGAFETNLHELVTKALTDILDPSTLTRCRLEDWKGDPFFLEWLPQCEALTTLIIEISEAEGVALCLEDIHAVLPELHALKALVIATSPFDPSSATAELPSPIPLPIFLSALPPNLVAAFLSAVYFEIDPSVPIYDVAAGEAPPPGPGLLGFLQHDHGGDDELPVIGKAEFRLMAKEGGTKEWVVLRLAVDSDEEEDFGDDA